MNVQTLEENWEYYYPKVYGYFFRRLNNRSDVEDLSSVVLTKFLEVLCDPEKEKAVTHKNAYLWKIAYNQLANFINQKQKYPISINIDEEFTSVESFVDIPSEHFQERVTNLMRCVENSLQGVEYEIVKKSILEDQTSVQISAILNLKPAAIRQKLSRSLKKLRLKCKQLWQE